MTFSSPWKKYQSAVMYTDSVYYVRVGLRVAAMEKSKLSIFNIIGLCKWVTELMTK